MKLLIKQRVFSWSDTYDVYDESEHPKYFVRAKVFSFGHQIHVFDCRTNQEVGMIRQKLLTFLPKFEIEIAGSVVGVVQKQLTFFHPQYQIDCNGWIVEGDFWGWNYQVMSGGAPIMRITKELFHWGDTYILDFQNSADELMGLLLVIAIDAANCNDNN